MNVLCHKMVTAFLKRQNDIFIDKEDMVLQILENRRGQHTMDTNYSNRMQARICQGLLRMSTARVFWNDDSTGFLQPFSSLVMIHDL